MTSQYNANFIETMPFSDTCAQINCAAGVVRTYTVPGNSRIQYQAYFEYISTANVFVRVGSAPTVPASGTVNSETYNEFRPIKRYVRGGDVIQFITPDTNAYIGVSLRQLPG